MTTQANEEAWITNREAGRRLGLTHSPTVRRVLQLNGVRARQLPGCRTKFFAEDVDRVARASIGTLPEPATA